MVTPMKIYNLMLHIHGTCLYVHEHTSKCSLKHFFRSLKSQLFFFKEKKKNPIFPQFWENNFFHTKKGFNIPLPYKSLIFSETVSLAWGNYFFPHFTNSYLKQTNEEYNTPSTPHSKITFAFFIISSAKAQRTDRSNLQLITASHSS